MRLDYQLEMKMDQKLLMTPQLQQALKLLQLPVLDLRAYLEQQCLENPLLEIVEESSEAEAEAERELDFSWEHNYFGGGNASESQEKTSFEQYTAATLTLQQRLKEQLSLLSISDIEMKTTHIIVDSLRDDGYLPWSCEEIACQAEVRERVVASALKVVQSLEPAGIGARNLRECLLLQLNRRQDVPPLAWEIVRQHLKLVAKGRIPMLAENLGADYSEVQKAIDYIKGLEPKPGLGLDQGGTSPYVIPDVTLLDVSGKWVILVNDSSSCHLRLSAGYQNLLANSDSVTRKYLQERLSSALWLLKSIEQRRSTLYKITEFILEYQEAYFFQGVQGLRPMRLKEVAQALAVHESTVSRAINGKHLQTPKGILAFKYFFAVNLDTYGGPGVATTGVKELLEQIVESEDKSQPLTDEGIALCLQDRGIRISRRTVAKYREQLGIPNSTLRKRWC